MDHGLLRQSRSTSSRPDARRALVCVALLTAGSVDAARLKPPSEAIKEEQNVVLVAEVVKVGPEQQLVLERVEALHGESEPRIEVRLIDPGPEVLAAGDRRIFGYSELQRSIRYRNAFERDPAGARVIEIPSVGAAILEESASMRSLTAEVSESQPLDDPQILGAILEQVQREHVQSRRFVLSELVLRPPLLDRIDDEGYEILRQTLLSGSLEPMAHDYLIRALLPRATDERVRPWLRAGCRQALESRPPELDLRSFNPALVKVAAVALGKAGRPEDVALLAKHLHSNNPGVARESWRSIHRLDPGAASGLARQALEAGGLRPEVRETLERALAETQNEPEGDRP